MATSLTDDPRLGFELSQLAATIAQQIHRADVLRGEAPDLPFRALELPMRRHYLSIGEKAILLRPARDQVVNVDQFRVQAKAALRAIQRNRPFCLTGLGRPTHGGGQ